MAETIYLDYNATAPIRESVMEKVLSAMKVEGNPSSVHGPGRRAKAIVEEARTQVAALVNARARDIVFTSGGTEANNAVLRATGAKTLIISEIEHDCVLAAAKASGLATKFIKVDANGVVSVDHLKSILAEDPEKPLVSVMMANNEAGVVQPIQQIVEIAKGYGASVHCDAVQAAGRLEIDFTNLGLDYLTLSSHKIGGPQGVGAVVLAPTAPLNAFITGGGQELGRRSGTENVSGTAGFGVAAIEALSDIHQTSKIKVLKDRLETALRESANDVIIVGDQAPRLANTSCLIMPGVKGETQVMHFDLNGIAVSSGSACSSGKVKASHVLKAMGFDDDIASCSIRVSLGLNTNDSDIDAFIEAWNKLYARTQRA